MVLATALAHGHSNQTNKDVNRDVALGGYAVSLIYLAYVIDIFIMINYFRSY